MNSIKDRVIADISASTPKNGKERAVQYYLCLVGLYVVFVFNEFVKRPVDYLALGLIIGGLPLINKNNIKLLRVSISQSVAAKMVCWSLIVMSALFFLATLQQLPRYDGLIAFAAQYGVHVGLAGIALLVIPLNDKTIDFLFDCLLLALFALVLADIGFYIWDIKNNIAIGSNYSHRWFGDGYVFLAPFLLARILANQDRLAHQASPRPSNACLFFQLSLYLLLFLVVVLCGGTGSRSTYLLLVCEILFFFSLKAYRSRSSWIKIIATSIILLVTLKIAFGFLAPTLLDGAISRGLRIWDRVLYAWIPGILLIEERPILGYGFGAAIWDFAYTNLQFTKPEIINFGSPHSWFLAAAFYGGVPAALAQVLMAAGLVGLTLKFNRCLTKSFIIFSFNNPNNLLLGLLTSFISFYLIRGLVEFTIYKYLGVIVLPLLIINLSNDVNYDNG